MLSRAARRCRAAVGGLVPLSVTIDRLPLGDFTRTIRGHTLPATQPSSIDLTLVGTEGAPDRRALYVVIPPGPCNPLAVDIVDLAALHVGPVDLGLGSAGFAAPMALSPPGDTLHLLLAVGGLRVVPRRTSLGLVGATGLLRTIDLGSFFLPAGIREDGRKAYMPPLSGVAIGRRGGTCVTQLVATIKPLKGRLSARE